MEGSLPLRACRNKSASLPTGWTSGNGGNRADLDQHAWITQLSHANDGRGIGRKTFAIERSLHGLDKGRRLSLIKPDDIHVGAHYTRRRRPDGRQGMRQIPKGLYCLGIKVVPANNVEIAVKRALTRNEGKLAGGRHHDLGKPGNRKQFRWVDMRDGHVLLLCSRICTKMS